MLSQSSHNHHTVHRRRIRRAPRPADESPPPPLQPAAPRPRRRSLMLHPHQAQFRVVLILQMLRSEVCSSFHCVFFTLLLTVAAPGVSHVLRTSSMMFLGLSRVLDPAGTCNSTTTNPPNSFPRRLRPPIPARRHYATTPPFRSPSAPRARQPRRTVDARA
jgi:hypothetical protein